MKKLRRIACMLFAASVATVSMAQDYNPWPWDFPQDVKIKAEVGQKALSCYSQYFKNVKDSADLKKGVLIYYAADIERVEGGKTIVSKWREEIEVPNALVLPLDKNAKAKKGDVVLTWWQSGSGMDRGYVVDDSTPQEPKVVYLDLSWPDNPDDPKIEEKNKGEQLKPSTFTVLKDGQWMPGMQVAYRSEGEWKWGTIVQMAGDKLLVSTFASHLDATTKDRAKLIPINEKIKEGDKVSVVWLDQFKPGYIVTKVDKKNGHIYVKSETGSRVEAKSILQVTKVLN